MNIGGYHVVSLVGEAPTAVVYQVKHPTLQSVHACKLVPPTISNIPSVRAAFLQRIQWCSEHPNPFFVRVTDIIETEEHLGFAMDWLDGESLGTHLTRFSIVDSVSAVRWAVQILSALHVLHQDGQVHLDIHPGNIFLHKTGNGWISILMDAGIHRFVEVEGIQFSDGVERVRYRAPEEIHKRDNIGPWTDVYRLGVVLYEMLVGRPPFDGATEYSVMHAINGGRYQSLAQASQSASPELIEIVHKAINSDPRKRYANAFEMLSAIQSSIKLPDALEPVEPVSSTATDSTEHVDILIEKNGEWILQSSMSTSPDPEDDWEDESMDDVVVSRGKRFKLHIPYPALFWRFRYGIFASVLSIMAVYILWLGGLFGGRDSTVEIHSAPLWGMTKAILDEQPVSGRRTNIILELGEHHVDVSGGISNSGDCGRCCWSSSKSFVVPFGWGDFTTVVDVQDVVSGLSCPTIEQEYLFESVNIRQGWMGAPSDLPMRADNSLWHQVQLLTPFWMGKTEVTQKLYAQVMNSIESGEELLPKREVSWMEAIQFCNHLSEIEGLETCYQVSGDNVSWEKGVLCPGYRLPTEAEWELAARANSPLIIDGKFHWFAGGSNASLLAWYESNSTLKVHSVGGKYPNALGLYDLSGNVSEWVWDGYRPYLGDATNPKGVQSSKKVIRGGHFRSPQTQIRVFDRGYASKSYRSETIGFRIVRTQGIQ